jgi:hypothetical protein
MVSRSFVMVLGILTLFGAVSCSVFVFPGSLYPNNAWGQTELDDPVFIDEIAPSILITAPSWCSSDITNPGLSLIQGTAGDLESGLRHVEALSHTYPFNDEYNFERAAPMKQGDWSSWSITLPIYDTRTRVLVKATDNAGNENWDEIIIDFEEQKSKLEARTSGAIAFVDPAFTSAAYNLDGFYEFYDKHDSAEDDEEITSDFNLLTADIPADPEREYFMPILKRVEDFVRQEVPVSIISDIDVHNGFIFRSDGTNAYRALFLLHNEYVTQQEYDNLRKYVFNGGTIVLIDGNIFYGEVTFDEKLCTATLVKGHDWEFDGTVAKKSVSERYFDENREWVGTNYMINSLWDPVSFSNNPFNYTHFEENYISNPNATILHDFGLTIGDDYESEPWHKNQKVAIHELKYGAGKVLGLGIYGQIMSKNSAFLDYFERVVLMHAIANRYIVATEDNEYPVYWSLRSGSLSQVDIDQSENKLILSIDRTTRQTDVLKVALPKALINAQVSLGEYSTTEDGIVKDVSFEEFEKVEEARTTDLAVSFPGIDDVSYRNADIFQLEADYARYVEIPLSEDADTIEVQGTYVVPEFPLLTAFAVSGLMIMISIGAARIFRQQTARSTNHTPL